MNIPSDIGFVFPMRPDCPCNFDFTSVCLYRMFFCHSRCNTPRVTDVLMLRYAKKLEC
jgi:hypothetical protein